MWHILVYQLCHCNIWHLAANVYCLWLIAVSNYRVRAYHCIVAYAISCLLAAGGPETQGLSGAIYCLVGMLSWQASRISAYHMWMAAFIGAGFLFSDRINVWLHVFGYLSGVLIEMQFVPWRERLTRYWR